MTLREFFTTHFAPDRLQGRSPGNRKAYITAIRRFKAFIGHEPTLNDLDPMTFATFPEWLSTRYQTKSREVTIWRVQAVWRMPSRFG